MVRINLYVRVNGQTMSKVLICVAWPYANGAIHLGHLAGSILPSDIFSRYNKLLGNDVLIVSGSDQHGTPITVTAEKEGVTPNIIADKFHEINKKAIENMGVEYSLFTKTHNQNHINVVQSIFAKLLEKGYLYTGESDQYYCPKCNKFLPDRYVEGTCPKCGAERIRGDQCDFCGKIFETGELKDAYCVQCRTEPKIRSTKHYFFKLSTFKKFLLEYLDSKKNWRSNVKSFTTNWLKDGLHDRAITRDIEWGIPVPIDGWSDKSIYVWFDAVIGYLSASIEYSKMIGKPDYWREYWQCPEVKHYYFLGKDNIPFHSIIWPSILMGCGHLNLPYDIPANEYLMFKGGKFSKSRGGAIDIPSVLEKFDADVVRYYLTVIMPDTHDSEFTWADFESKINNELVSNLGNYWHRSLSFTKKNFGIVPKGGEAETGLILKIIDGGLKDYKQYLNSCNFKKAIKVVMQLSSEGNKYINNSQPWALVKTDSAACGRVMNAALTLAKALAIMTWPFMPKASDVVWKYLNMESTLKNIRLESVMEPITAGIHLLDPSPVFKRIEIPENWKIVDEKEESKKNDVLLEGSYANFRKLDIRVANVIWIDDHPEADRLYQMKVDVGEKEPRSIVAGLKAFYKKDEILGRKVLCLINLKPRKLRGIMSQGMLLAADDENNGGSTVLLLKPSNDSPVGTRMNCGLENTESCIDYEEFTKVTFKVSTVKDGVFNYNNGIRIQLPEESPPRVVAVIDNDKAMALSDGNSCVATVDRDIIDGANVR